MIFLLTQLIVFWYGKIVCRHCNGRIFQWKEISLQSGLVVSESLDPEKFEVYPIHILKEGWFYQDGHGKRFAVDKSNFSFSDGSQTIQPDVVFNTIHGTPGKTVYLAAYWELLEIPYTSTGFYPAALSFNKRDCLSVLKTLESNVPILLRKPRG